MPPLRIAIPIYPQVDMIDVASTVDALKRIPDYSSYALELDLVAATLDPIVTGQNVKIGPTKTFADYNDDPLDVLLLPGAGDTSGATSDPVLMKFVKTRGENARHVVSVCTGALILGSAGLLDGYRATTHWMAIGGLTAMKNVRVVNGYPRWVHDRNRLTTGGVASSLDGALYLISLLAGEQTAKCVQLLIQYNPHPPFDCGDPAVADADTYFRVAGG
ncbi:MAG TPA: DJ-1/PfpI family protein [Thermoanaerobaculia bacterium]|nr:DJ-1/PfpI family protein [Thermoanaerobaculia bacterium]